MIHVYHKNAELTEGLTLVWGKWNKIYILNSTFFIDIIRGLNWKRGVTLYINTRPGLYSMKLIPENLPFSMLMGLY